MVCANCGSEIREGIKFCPYCGEKIAVEQSEEEQPIYTADLKGLLKSGQLAVYRDRTEFVSSSVQKTIFNYSSLISVKKGLDRIFFITEDGRTESCIVSMKSIHEAFLHIEMASRPYIAERKRILLSKGIHYSLVSSQGLTGGILNILDDRVEFKAKTGQVETVFFQDVKSVCISSIGMLEFLRTDGMTKSFTLGKEMRDEVLCFLEKAIAPFLAERKAALRARGIYYSFLSSQGPDYGTLDILDDRVEFKANTGRTEVIFFQNVRAVGGYTGMLELGLTDGTSKSFTVDRDVSEEVLSFVENAVRPYVLNRTVDFQTVFGIDERIEINEKRGVFHIVRQGGNEITDEYPTGNIVKCEWTESSAPGSVLGGVLSGGMAILNSAVKAAGTQGTPSADEKISYAGVILTIRTEQGEWMETVRFGDFPLGANRTNKKYGRCMEERSRLMEYVGSALPDCEWTAPAPLAVESVPAETAADVAAIEEEVPEPADAAAEKDQFGIIKYIEGVSGFIGECAAPITIAIQGSWGSGKDGIMKMLSDSLEGCYGGNMIWLDARQFSRSDPDGQLPVLVGNSLISQLSGSDKGAAKDRAIKVAKGLINITSGFISQGGTDGQNLMDALFRDNAKDSLENLAREVSELVKKKADDGNGKVIILMDGLDKLAPAKEVELLEAMRNFFDCEGCVFVINVDYNSVIRGARERYGPDFDEKEGKSFFHKMFQVSFRVPVSGFHIQNYVKDKLEHMEIYTGDEDEFRFYIELIRHSVGCEPKSMDRLFNSFLLLKKLAGQAIYGNRDRRLMLFALLCMQTTFNDVYHFIVRMKDKVTPDFLSGLCRGRLEGLDDSWPDEEKKTEFRDFIRIFCDIINTDRIDAISDAECKVFAEVLDFSSITSQ